MGTRFFLSLAFFFAGIFTCLSQTPEWVSELAKNTFTFNIAEIAHWEEKPMTWYHVGGHSDNADSIRANTLYIEGTTDSGQKFIGAIPVANRKLNPLGTFFITSQTCTCECGCRSCQFAKGENGCSCDEKADAAQQNGACKYWCRHTITAGG